MIPVTRPVLPPLAEYVGRLEAIWASARLTNNGPQARALETALAEFLGVPHIVLLANGTLALQLAIKGLDLSGEVITTPFSFVATTSALAWEGCEPVLVDVEPVSLTLDPAQVEAAITPRTSAILATHVYGFPCDVDALEEIARRRGLRVIYDAAHAFGAGYRGRSLTGFGELSTLSFHATKLFHTVEGGAVVAQDATLAERLARLRNFGFVDQETISEPGINAKMSELHAAMGLCLLPRVPELIGARKQLAAHYDAAFAAAGPRLTRPRPRPGTEPNYAYYPILLETEALLHRVRRSLESAGVEPRRYFHPSLSTLPFGRTISDAVGLDAARRVLCLPLWAGLAETDAARIAEIVAEVIRTAPAEGP
jgi:dTDP-4-amino-4,6-dideoxygalactose transaminase